MFFLLHGIEESLERGSLFLAFLVSRILYRIASQSLSQYVSSDMNRPVAFRVKSPSFMKAVVFSRLLGCCISLFFLALLIKNVREFFTQKHIMVIVFSIYWLMHLFTLSLSFLLPSFVF